MGVFEEAVVYATNKHNGKVRKTAGIPAILHSMEVAEIIATMTTDMDVLVAGLLHDVVEDTDGTLEEIRARFGNRVAEIVGLETENKYEGEDKASSWKRRKEESIKALKASSNRQAEMLWLADKLSNIRSLVNSYREKGEEIWDVFNQKDPRMHQWYYKTVAEAVEMHLNRTGAFKEYIQHINYIWPGTFSNEKTKFKEYREVSLDGCKFVASGAKADVYRYNDELVLKLYNEDNEFKDIERESALTRLAFVLGVPTVIPFGIVKVGNRYGAMFELLTSKPISLLMDNDPKNNDEYVVLMADLAKKLHSTRIDRETDLLPKFKDRAYRRINEGVAYEDKEIADKICAMIDELPETNTLVHGDFHTGNVIAHRDEYLVIDLDELSIGHPIFDLGELYMAYKGFWEVEPFLVERLMPFSVETGIQFFEDFMKEYLGRDDIEDVMNKAALLCYARLVRKCCKKGKNLSAEDRKAKDYYMGKVREYINKVDSLDF